MQSKLIATLLVVTVFSSFGCAPESKNSSSGPSSPPNQSEPQPQDPPGPPSTDCTRIRSFEDCIVTTDIKLINDRGDYNYKDPFENETFPDSQIPSQYIQPQRLLDLNINSESLKVGEYFTLGEFVTRRKGRYGILAPLLVRNLDSVRSEIASPIVITSGYRGPKYNSRINDASKWSRHMYGDAADMASPGVSLLELRDACLARKASFVLVYSTHIHCDWRNYPLSHIYFPSDIPLPRSATLQAFLSARFQWRHPEVMYGSSSIVTGLIDPDEEEGELLVEWNIRTPSGTVQRLTGETVEVFWDERGEYEVRAIVGGLYPHSESITVE